MLENRENIHTKHTPRTDARNPSRIPPSDDEIQQHQHRVAYDLAYLEKQKREPLPAVKKHEALAAHGCSSICGEVWRNARRGFVYPTVE